MPSVFLRERLIFVITTVEALQLLFHPVRRCLPRLLAGKCSLLVQTQ